MDTNEMPKRPWRRKKRWSAAMLMAVASAYPLSFVPAMWVATRMSHRPEHQQRLSLLCRLYRPVAVALIESPHPCRNVVYWAVELGTPDGVAFARDYDRGVMWIGRGPTPEEGYSYTLLYY